MRISMVQVLQAFLKIGLNERKKIEPKLDKSFKALNIKNSGITKSWIEIFSVFDARKIIPGF